jgi:predicted RNA-binding protein YlxR (DUF448 family)
VDVPTRTCLACRTAAAKPSLVRLSVADGSVQVDPHAILQARGAYLCATQDCTEVALRREGAAVARALRMPRTAVHTEQLRAALEVERARRTERQTATAKPSRGVCT